MLRRALFCALLISCGTEPTAGLDSGVPDVGNVSDAGPMAGELIISSELLDLGKVLLQTTSAASFMITNNGTEPRSVSVSQPGGADAALFARTVNIPETDGRFTLEGGGVAMVNIEVTPDKEGAIVATISIDSEEFSAQVLLQAEGVLTGVVCPVELNLGLSNPGACIQGTVICENTGNATERITAVELEPTSDPALALIEPALPINLDPGETSDFDLEYCPQDIGEHTGELLVFTFMPFETEHRIRIVGNSGGPAVECAPAAVDFGSVGVGATITSDVICTNTGFMTAELSGALLDGTDFLLLGNAAGQIEPGDSFIIQVVATPQSSGQKQDTLQVTSNDPDSPVLDIPVSAEALDLDPCTASISPEAADFGLVGIGSVGVQTFSVVNGGATDCLFRQVELTVDSNPALFVARAPLAGEILTAGQTAEIDVHFLPTINAVAIGALNVSFSNPDTMELSADLEGVGGAGPVVIEPAIIDIGPTALGCAAPAEKRINIRRVLPGSGVVNRVELAGPDAQSFGLGGDTFPVLLDFYGVAEVVVRFDPMRVGPHTAQLQVFVAGLPTPVLVPLFGEGVMDTMRTDSTTLSPRAVDVLFVVDDSCSMGPAQAGLSTAVARFTDAIVARGGDVNIGVVTTDMEDPSFSGRLQGSPTVLDETTPDLFDVLSARVVPGIEGSGDEQGIAAAVAAVGPLSMTDNAGFLRPDADLIVVIVSDEPDFSPNNPTVAQSVGVLRVAAGRGALSIAAIVGPAQGTCDGPYGGGSEAPRYAEFVARSDQPLLLSFCDDMTESLAAFSEHVFGGSRFPLTSEPLISTISVFVNGSEIPENGFAGANWVYSVVNRELVFVAEGLVPAGATVEINYQAFCASPTCGDTTVDPGEECDDGNMFPGDACNNCRAAVCGDAVTRVGDEQCDDGNLNNTDGCLNNCLAASCGDGFVQLGVEECDDGNTISGDGCPATCRFYTASGLVSQPFVPLAAATALTPQGGQDPADDGLATIAMPFEFLFFDAPTSTLTVSVNGFASVGTFTPGDSFENTPIPEAGSPDGLMAVWWEDLFFDTTIPGGASIGYEVLGAAPNRTLVVEWRDLRIQNQSTANHRRFTFQLHLEEGTNVIRFHYADTETRGGVPTVASGSVGIEDPSGSRGIEALGCSPGCDGRPRPPRPDGFPEQATITFTP